MQYFRDAPGGCCCISGELKSACQETGVINFFLIIHEQIINCKLVQQAGWASPDR